MGLEDKIVLAYNNVGSVAKWMVNHPKTSGVLGYFTSLGGTACVSTAQNNPSPGNVATHVGVGLGTYWGLKLVNEYILGNRDVVEPEEKKGFLGKIRNYINKIEYAIFNNPAFSSLIPGSAAYLLYNHSFKDFTKTWTPEESLFLIPLLYPPSHLTLGMRRANEFFTRAYDKLKSNKAFLRFSDFILEKPMLSAGAVGLGYFYSTLKSLTLALENEPGTAVGLASLTAFLPACATYAAHTVAAGLFHSSSLKLAVKNSSITIDNLIGKYDSAIDNLEELLELPTSPEQKARIHVKIADIYAKQKKIDLSLSHIKPTIDLLGEKKTSLTPFNWLWTIPSKTGDIIKYYINGLKNNSIAKTQQSIFNFKRKKFDKAIEKINHAISLSSNDLSFSIIKAIELDAIKKYDDANKVWVSILPDMHKDFEIISNSSKEVFQITSNILANDFIIPRSSNVDALKAEYGFSRFSYDCCTDKQKVPKPLAFFVLSESDFDQKMNKDLFRKPAYFVNSRSKGEVLADTNINESIILKVLESYFDFVARTTKQRHKLGEYSVEAPVLNYGKTLVEKCFNRIPVGDKKKARLFENSESFINHLNGCKRFLIHGNFHTGNIIKGDVYCIIDFGDMCLALDTLGIEQFIAKFAFNKNAKVKIYESCHDFDSVKRSKDDFMKDGLMGSVFQAACLLGRSYHYKEGNLIDFQRNISHSLSALLHLDSVKGKEKDQLLYFRDDVASLQFNASVQIN